MNQLTLEMIDNVLEEYVAQFVPAMMRFNYHLILVKGGEDFPHLLEQSHFSHIITGVFGLAELLKFVVTQQIRVFELDEMTLRNSLALFSIHEVHKAKDYDKIDSTEFSIPLERLRQEYEALGLNSFAEVDEFMMRQANLHKRSYRQGDRLLSSEKNSSLIYLLTRIADTFASVKSPSEAVSSLRNYLKDLGPAFNPKKYRLYFHEIKDVRGVLTNTIHQIVSEKLNGELGFFPLLYFATGTLYIGRAELSAFNHASFLEAIVNDALQSLAEYGQVSDAAIRVGQRAKYFDFEKFVYSFANVPKLLSLVRDDTVAANVKIKDIDKDFSGLLQKKGLPSGWNEETLESKFALKLDEPKLFQEHWARTRRYLFYVDKIVRELNPTQDPIEWFLQNFTLPENAATNLREVGALWAKGGPGKYVLPVAYHFLRGQHFDDRPPEARTTTDVMDILHRHVSATIKQIDTNAGRQMVVEALGFRSDLSIYLDENLYLSFDQETVLTNDNLNAYIKVKNKNPSTDFCSMCGRSSEYIIGIRTGISDDFAQIFSNRMLPVRQVQGNRAWCPICHLEFIFRKLTGLGLPSGAHYKNSYHIFLYVLPTFSFTREHIRLFRRFLQVFSEPTDLPVQDYGQNWGLPHYWLEKRQLDPEWIDQVFDVFEQQAERLRDWGNIGERIVAGQIKGQPHYYLLKWTKSARDTERKDERIATRTEAWAKAIFVSAVIAGLTGYKVYVTERPYLPIADPAELKATIHLDSPPPPMRGLLDGKSDTVSLYGRELGNVSGLERVLDLSAALWAVTTSVRANAKDKHIAQYLGHHNVNDLAGAHFYKDYARRNEGKSPLPPLDLACQILLEIRGGKLMNLVEEIGKAAIAVRLPHYGSGRGKVHSYEMAFREAVDALRKSMPLIPDLRKTALTGQKPPAQAIAELKDLASGALLKTMERQRTRQSRKANINPWTGNILSQETRVLIDILVDRVYLERAGGSFARFLQMENVLADGVYYYTDTNLSALRDKYKQQFEQED